MMVKKTVLISNPTSLSLRLGQMVIKNADDGRERTVPVEDIGVVVLDSGRIIVTNALLAALNENCCCVVTCDARHMPTGMLLPVAGNTVQAERSAAQAAAATELKDGLWQKTVSRKILNQASVLHRSTGKEHSCMLEWSNKVSPGDQKNLEARAASYYWKRLFPEDRDFTRSADGHPVNALLNYGYAILRAAVARAIVSSGILPVFGIHHHNRYDAYCLADDVMEPYRPYVDRLVLDMIKTDPGCILDHDTKVILLGILTTEVIIEGRRSPLMASVTATTASLGRCYLENNTDVVYPMME